MSATPGLYMDLDVVLSRIVLTKSTTGSRKDGYQSYVVTLGKEILGFVEHADETVDRVAGGRVTNRWTRKCWRYRSAHLEWVRLFFDTRKRALRGLVEQLDRKGKLAPPQIEIPFA